MSQDHNNGRKLPPEVLTRDEMERLLARCSRRAPTGVRNRAMLTLFYRAGLRCAEALALRPTDVDAEAGTIRVLLGKGRKARTVGLDQSGLALIEHWLVVREKHGINGHSPLICTLAGGTVKGAYVRALLKRLGRKAGIVKRVHPHGLRHSFAAELAQEGVPLPTISGALGHANSAVTARYIDHIAPQDVIEAMKERDWTRKEKAVATTP